MRANPVWPMPGLERVVESLSSAGMQLGIISNAQFFTPLLFPALTGSTLAELGFRTELCYYSYQHGQAKPGLFMFERARETLSQLGMAPGQVLYIGNDVLNDMMPAGKIGFRTALFAGDRRSLRLREGDARVAGVEPDLVVSALEQILPALGIGAEGTR